MLIEIDDWKFDVDIAATMEYSAAEAADHCTCAYCRNFYAAVDDTYPELRRFLAQFGLDLEAPEELMPFEPTLYLAYYCVSGRVLEFGHRPIIIDGQKILPELPGSLAFNTGCKEPYFNLSVGPFELPWVLNEPMDEVRSPANEPTFLQKMWNTLLRRQPKDKFPT